jgi:hypothetical protein
MIIICNLLAVMMSQQPQGLVEARRALHQGADAQKMDMEET